MSCLFKQCWFRPQDIVWGERDVIRDEKKRQNMMILKFDQTKSFLSSDGTNQEWPLVRFVHLLKRLCSFPIVHYQRAPDNSHSQKPYQTNPAPTDPKQREFWGGHDKEEQMLHVSVRIEEGTKWQTRSREGWGQQHFCEPPGGRTSHQRTGCHEQGRFDTHSQKTQEE